MQPNLVVWWAGSLSMLLLVAAAVLRPKNWRDPLLWFLLAGYAMNWLPFALIPRVMFLHSYFCGDDFQPVGDGVVNQQTPMVEATPRQAAGLYDFAVMTGGWVSEFRQLSLE